MSRERGTMLGVWVAAAVACLLGVLDPPEASLDPGLGRELLDLLRVLTTAALAIALLLGPGLLCRAAGRRLRLAFLPLPGLALLAAVAGLAWLVAATVEPRVVCFAILGPILGLMLAALLARPGNELLDGDERRVLLIVSLALGLAIGRSLWSLGPEGELFEGTISHTIVPEGRPDSRTSFFVTALVNQGGQAYGGPASELFAPYNFSSRGPLAGMASAPVVLMSGGDPQLTAPEAAWQPFDPQGFMAFRLAMVTFSCTVLLSLWDLVRQLGGRTAARFALLLGAGTPFLFADLWFTWPKLLAASFVLLGAILLFERRPLRSGVSVGVGYLVHPSALIGLSALLPLALWPLKGANWRRPRLGPALLLLAGAGAFMLFWRLLAGEHYLQEGFFEYVRAAYPDWSPSPGEWLYFRVNSLADTFVPLYLPLFQGDDISINQVGGGSPAVVHWFFQPWTGLPFGFAIVFLPLLLSRLWKALRRWPWGVTATVLIPAAAFTVYWGASRSGMLREGMQSWVLAVLAVVALQQAAAGFPWLRSRLCRAIVSLRGLEVLALAVGATVGTRGLSGAVGDFALVDGFAIAAVLACSLALVSLTWIETGRIGDAGRSEGDGGEAG